MYKFLLSLCLYSILSGINIINAQTNLKDFPIDTSYTVYSAFQKLIKDYPYIKIVSTAPSEKIKTKENIIYTKYSERELHIDIFEPLREKNTYSPAVILIHGGGWRSGSKSMMHPLAEKLAENGYIAVAVEYRLSPEAKFPAAIYDLKSSVRWLKQNADEYKVDTNRVAILGCSAGGTLAAFTGVTNNNPKFEVKYDTLNISSNVNAIIDIDGILDFTDPAEGGKDNDPEKPSSGKLWFGSSFKENPEMWIEASPLNYFNGKTPPVIFINSSQERFHAGRDEAIEKLQSFNVYFELHTIRDSPHTFWLFDPWFNETSELVLHFLDKIFVN